MSRVNVGGVAFRFPQEASTDPTLKHHALQMAAPLFGKLSKLHRKRCPALKAGSILQLGNSGLDS